MLRNVSTAACRLVPVFALCGLLAVGGCSPEGKGKVKLGNSSKAEYGPAQPPKQDAAKPAGNAPKVRSIKGRMQAEAE